MLDFDSKEFLLDDQKILDLVRRMELKPVLLRRSIEEQIVELVPVDQDWLDCKRAEVLGNCSEPDWLAERNWTSRDLVIHLWRPEALKRFADQRFGPGVEDVFLKQAKDADHVVYSLIRVKDQGLARELWIRLEENEITFPEAATEFGQGPEARHLGVIGPIALKDIHPLELRQRLRRLQPGEINSPLLFGEWTILLRLERLIPAVFDLATRQRLISSQLDEFLQQRQNRLLAGEPVDQLEYSCSP